MEELYDVQRDGGNVTTAFTDIEAQVYVEVEKAGQKFS